MSILETLFQFAIYDDEIIRQKYFVMLLKEVLHSQDLWDDYILYLELVSLRLLQF